MIKRTMAIVVFASLSCGLPALAQDATEGGTRVARPGTDAAISLLDKRVERVDWVDKPFEGVIDWMRDESEGQVNVVPRWGPLSVESVDEDSLITLQLSNTSVGEVLIETIDQLSEDGALGFLAYENTLKISTRGDFDRKMYVRVYDATDLLFEVPDMGEAAPKIDLQKAGKGGGGSGGGGQGVFGGAGGGGGEQSQGGEQAEQDRTERLERLRDMIMVAVAPSTWNTIGTSIATGQGAAGAAGRGRISIYNSNLIVLNTIEVHEQLAGLFSFSD